MKDSRLTKVSFICYPLHTYINDNGQVEEGGIDDIDKTINLIRDKISSYAYILHDKDVLENGEEKKAHYHVILIFHKAEHIKPILKLFKTNVYETIKNINGCVQYLVHKGHSEKHQYDVNDVVSRNLDVKRIIDSFIVDNDIESGLKILFKYIPNCVDLIDLIDYAVEEKLYNILQKNYFVIRDYFNIYKKREEENIRKEISKEQINFYSQFADLIDIKE